MVVPTSITNHPEWKKFRKYFRIERYVREGGGSSNPRFRIEVKSVPLAVSDELLAIQVRCVECGAAIHPVRSRTPPGNKRGNSAQLYCAVACPLTTNVGCSRGAAAREEYTRIRQALYG